MTPDELAAYFDSMAAAAELTIASLEALPEPSGTDLRALSARYAEGRRDAFREAAETIRDIHRQG